MSALQIYDFESNAIRVIPRDELPWFVAADVCRALGIENHRMAVSKLDDDERDDVSLTDAIGREQANLAISESGLYTLILRSRDAVKPGTVAHRFRKWVTAKVLPEIRETGSYSRPTPLFDDGRAWGLPLAKINTCASLMRAVQASFGPEAARELYNREPDLPRLAGFSVGQITGTSRDDAAGCIRHLLRAATANGIPLRNRYTLALHDKASEKSLADYGIGIGRYPNAEMIYIARTHPFLNEHFADTQWCGAWDEALRSLPGVKPVRYEIQFGKVKSKALAVPRAVIHKILHPWD